MDMENTDVLEDILRHLPPVALAASRCVCKAWKATVDHHRLLRADLLPLSLDGVFYSSDEMGEPEFFARHSTATRYITSRLDYVGESLGCFLDVGGMTNHCNGLVLVFDWDVRAVVNPATRQWASLPPLPCPCPSTSREVNPCGRCCNNRYLVYDPTASPHYEVLYTPRVPLHLPPHDAAAYREEWPPSPYVMHVFSSKTNCWMERSFIRQGDAPGTTVAHVKSHYESDESLYYSALWQGSLYVPSRLGFLLRINLSNDQYQVIKLPKQGKGSLDRIGKSKKGVYCVLRADDGGSTFQIWLLSESCDGAIDWVLNNEINFDTAWRIYPYKNMSLDHKELLLKNDVNHQVSESRIENGPWVLQSHDQQELLLKNHVNHKVVEEYHEALSRDDFQWDSDHENAVTTVHWPKKCNPGCTPCHFRCLGFHPYKEIALFHDDDTSITFAYYFKTSKAQYLGKMYHSGYDVEFSFAYTPCWRMDLPGNN